MVAQSTQAPHTFVRHISGTPAAFTVTVVAGRRSTTYHADAKSGTCTCEGPQGGWCAHLVDAGEFLADHACPFCGRYSPFACTCAGCVQLGIFDAAVPA